MSSTAPLVSIEPNESSTHHSFYFVQTQFNMHMSFKWLLFFILSDQNFVHITLPSHATCPFNPSSLISPFLFPRVRLTNLFHSQIQCGHHSFLLLWGLHLVNNFIFTLTLSGKQYKLKGSSWGTPPPPSYNNSAPSSPLNRSCALA
jgi:hypothetical protein